MCESLGGRPGLPVPIVRTASVNIKQTFKRRTAPSKFRSCVKVEVDVLGSPSLLILMVPINPYGALGSPSLTVLMVSVDVKQTFKRTAPSEFRSCVKVQVVVLGSPSILVRKASVDIKQTFKRRTAPSKFRSCVKVEVDVLGSPSQ